MTQAEIEQQEYVLEAFRSTGYRVTDRQGNGFQARLGDNLPHFYTWEEGLRIADEIYKRRIGDVKKKCPGLLAVRTEAKGWTWTGQTETPSSSVATEWQPGHFEEDTVSRIRRMALNVLETLLLREERQFSRDYRAMLDGPGSLDAITSAMKETMVPWFPVNTGMGRDDEPEIRLRTLGDELGMDPYTVALRYVHRAVDLTDKGLERRKDRDRAFRMIAEAYRHAGKSFTKYLKVSDTTKLREKIEARIAAEEQARAADTGETEREGREER